MTVTLVSLASLGSPLVAPASAATANVSVQNAQGNVISTATDGQTVYVNANVSSVNGTTVGATVKNASGTSIGVQLYDDGTTTGGPGDDTDDGEYWGSFTVSASSTDDGNDVLQVDDGSTAEVSVDLDGDGNDGTATITADYGPTPQSATTFDDDGNGTIDTMTVTFDEAIDGSVSYATSDFTVSGATTVTGIASNDGDATLRLEVDSAPTNDTGITPDVTVAQNAVQDTNGNAGPAGGSETVTATDEAAPVALNATYSDSAGDGLVDQVLVTYSEDVADSVYANSDWTITTPGSISLSKNGTGSVTGNEVRIDVSGTAETTGGATPPELDYTGTSIHDGRNAAPAQALTVQDGAAPTLAGVTTADRVSDGTVDNLTVTFTEAVAAGSVEAADFAIDSADGLSGTVSGVTDDDGDATVNVTLVNVTLAGQADTGSNPTLAYASGTGAAVQDAAGNRMADTTSDPATDGAAPYPVQITMVDGLTADGTVDIIGIRYSENVSASSPEAVDYSLGGSDADAVTIDEASIFDQASMNDSVVALNVTAPANDTGLDLTLSYDASAGASGSITDGSNPAVSVSDRSIRDAAAPLMQSVTTVSFGSGTVGMIQVVFTEPVDDGTVDPGDFSLSTGSVDSVRKSLTMDNQTQLGVVGFPTDTSVTPDVTLAEGSIYAPSQPRVGNPKQTLTATDGAPPAIVAASTADADDDGVVDRIDLTFSEPIDDGASTLDASAFSLSAGSVDGVTTGATADDDALRLSVSGLSGSDATPDVTVASGTPVDPLGNAVPESRTFTGTTSGAAPAVESATTLDRDGDGSVDAANVTFTGPVDDSTLAAGDWALGGTAVEGVDTLSGADDDTVQLRITTDANEVSGTGPANVTYTPGSAVGLGGNPISAVDAADVTEIDGATPIVEDVSASTDSATQSRVEVTVTASESLDGVTVDLTGPTSRTLSSFTVSGSGPYTHTLTTSVDASGTYTASLQRAADADGNGGASGQQAAVEVSLPSSGGSGAPSAPGSPSTRGSSATVAVFSGVDTATFDLSDGPVGRVEVRSQGSATGFARATSLSSLPSGVPSPDGRTVSAVSLQMPGEWRTSDAAVRMTVDASAVDGDPDRLRIARYDDVSSSWTTLETSVERGAGETLIVTAQTPGFSVFAVTAVEEPASPTSTPTQSDTVSVTSATPAADGESTADTATATDTATDTATTTGTGAGFGALVALAGLFALIALQRRS
ncbi:hypothetical protein [Salinirarus marinus]|uniref:hypothetical protein n=1 Tax=Salinirarus marinus TaxID=3068310 RepID=UPI003C6C010B